MTQTRTALDDLVDRFVESLIPAHQKVAAAPYTAMEVRKDDLRAAAAALLRAHGDYLNAGVSATPPPAPPPPPAPESQ